MHSLLLTLALLAGDVSADSSRGKGGKTGLFTEQTLEIQGKARDYRLLVPRGVKPGKAVPLVFAFHGMGGDARRLASYCGLDALAKKEGFILVYASALDGRWKLRQAEGNEDLEFFDALYDLVCERYPVDRNRVYATGMSMGGYFSNFVAAHRAEKIAAIAPHSGGLGAVGMRGAGGVGGASGTAEHKVAVLIVHGDADTVVPVSEGRKSRDHYEKAGHPVQYEEIEGLGHRWATAQKINQTMWKFFVDHPRGKGEDSGEKKADKKDAEQADR